MRHVSFLILVTKLFTFLIHLQANFLIKINHARRREVYLVDNAKSKHLIIGMDTLTGLGYEIADIALVSESEVNSYKDGEDLSIGEMSLANKEKFRKNPSKVDSVHYIHPVNEHYYVNSSLLVNTNIAAFAFSSGVRDLQMLIERYLLIIFVTINFIVVCIQHKSLYMI
jgi:hypothetical protein